MTLATEDLRFALDDARRRHSAVVDLLAANDRQALGFLQLYVALAGGALSGAAAIVLSPANSFPKALGYGLFGFAGPLIFGAMFCMAAVWPSNINLPGRKPDFWIWANEVSAEQAFLEYLNNLTAKEAQNSSLNFRLSRLMTYAKMLGVAAPIVGLAVGAAALRWLSP
jgi:hypothetical protein